jgi:hypothetical protein
MEDIRNASGRTDARLDALDSGHPTTRAGRNLETTTQLRLEHPLEAGVRCNLVLTPFWHFPHVPLLTCFISLSLSSCDLFGHRTLMKTASWPKPCLELLIVLDIISPKLPLMSLGEQFCLSQL